jgi:hypothetical protein
LSGVVGPHFEALCRDWAVRSGEEAFGEFPSQVAATEISDPVRKTQIQVDVAALSADTPDTPKRVLSLGEAKWGEVIGQSHLDRLRRARDLLSVKGHNTTETVLACYSGAGFTGDLRTAAAADPRIILVGLDRIYIAPNR